MQSARARAAVRWHRFDEPEAYIRRILYTRPESWWRRVRRQPPVGTVKSQTRHATARRRMLNPELVELVGGTTPIAEVPQQ